MTKLLVVDDDINLVDTIKEYLTGQRYLVESAHSGEDGLELMLGFDYDLVVLDWGLPEMSGIDVLRQYRAQKGAARVIMLTAMSEIDDKEQGFNAGVDDYLTKPFKMKELGLRVAALLRRPAELRGEELTIGALVLNTAEHSVVRNGSEIALSPKEFALLELFLRYPDHVFSADALLDRIWKSEADVSAESVKVWIKRLRNKLGRDQEGGRIKTVHGSGYKLQSTD